MSNNTRKITWIFPLLVLFLTWPLLGAYITIFARAWLWLLVGCVFILVLCPSYYTQSHMIWMAVFIVVVLLNYFSGDNYYDSFPKACSEFAVLIFSSALAYHGFQMHNKPTAVFMMVELLIIFSIISIATYVLDLANPGIVRQSVREMFTSDDFSVWNISLRMGMTNYSLPHALPVILPPLIMGIKNKDQMIITRIVLILLLLLTVLLIYISGIATAILMAAMILIMAFFTRIGSVKHNILRLVIIVFIFLPLVLNEDLIIQIIDYLCDLVGGEGAFYERLVDIQESIIYDQTQGDLDARISLYTQSSEAFFTSIIWGTNISLGGHSAIVDRLAALGLVGFVPYVVFIWKHIKTTFRLIAPDTKLFYLEGLLAGIMMLMTKNMSNWEMWLTMFFLLPAMVLYFGPKDKTRTISE